jgi:SAM-dependent methyltransferase
MSSRLSEGFLSLYPRFVDLIPSSILNRLPVSTRAKLKAGAELAYWKKQFRREGMLGNAHYEFNYTVLFDLTPQDYANLRLLDIGCGPRGSLEWAGMTAMRVGVDPLLDRYRTLGIENHKMKYICAHVEAMPFRDAHFDVVTSFNSLDHVDNLDLALYEIYRVLKPLGRFLLIVETNHAPTPTEPIEITESALRSKLSSKSEIISWRVFALRSDHDIYRSIRDSAPFENIPVGVAGVVVSYMIKRE